MPKTYKRLVLKIKNRNIMLHIIIRKIAITATEVIQNDGLNNCFHLIQATEFINYESDSYKLF